MTTRHITEIDMKEFRIGKRVQVALPACPYSRRAAGIYRGTVDYVKGDHVGVWMSFNGYGDDNGFLTGAARITDNGVLIAGS
ncbi:hypothetical protein [Streptomyces sp. NPDC001205]